MELPFVFHQTRIPALRGPRALLGRDDPPPDLAPRTHGAWIRFAATGDPGRPACETGGRATMIIDEEWRLVRRWQDRSDG
ncbi:hypothetical protein [Nonomuraea lactucae]|uniref:hypothetical protein n=1 Tax=Nonomuraea lactucae TaxID=2249762 RepID=UPI000DE47B26|nr:hypothetical protein [Nonomuraea lactucae]